MDEDRPRCSALRDVSCVLFRTPIPSTWAMSVCACLSRPLAGRAQHDSGHALRTRPCLRHPIPTTMMQRVRCLRIRRSCPLCRIPNHVDINPRPQTPAFDIRTHPQRNNTWSRQSLCTFTDIHRSLSGDGRTLSHHRRTQFVRRLSGTSVLHSRNYRQRLNDS